MKYFVYSAYRAMSEPDKLIHDYTCLGNYNFGTEDIREPIKTRIRDERGRFMTQVTGYRTKKLGYINIETLDQLMGLREAVGTPLIIDNCDHGPEIMIYDSYIE